MLVTLTTFALASALALGLGTPAIAMHLEMLHRREARQRLEIENQRAEIEDLTKTVEGYRELVCAAPASDLAALALPDLGDSTPVQVLCLTR